MKKYITYGKINEILISIQENSGYNSGDFLEIEIKELVDLGYIEITNFNISINDFNNCKIKNEGENFLNSYNGCKKIEYFFQDFPFIGAIVIGIIGGTIGGLISVFF